MIDKDKYKYKSNLLTLSTNIHNNNTEHKRNNCKQNIRKCKITELLIIVIITVITLIIIIIRVLMTEIVIIMTMEVLLTISIKIVVKIMTYTGCPAKKTYPA